MPDYNHNNNNGFHSITPQSGTGLTAEINVNGKRPLNSSVGIGIQVGTPSNNLYIKGSTSNAESNVNGGVNFDLGKK